MRGRFLLLATSASFVVGAHEGNVGVAAPGIAAAAIAAPAIVAAAQPGGGVPAARSSGELVLAGGDPADRARLADTFRPSFAKLGVELTVKETSAMNPRDVGGGEALAPPAIQIWIDLGQPRAATVYVSEQRNVYVRKLALGAHFDAVSLELIDVVVTSSVETVLAGRELGIPRREFLQTLAPATPSPAAPPTPPPVAPPASTESESRPPLPTTRIFSAALLYEADLRSADTASHGPGASIELRRFNFSYGLAVQGRLSHEVVRNEATLRLASGSLRLSIGRTFVLPSHLVLTAGAAVSAELTHVRTASTASAYVPAGSSWSASPLVRPFLELDRELGRMMSAGLLAGVDCDLAASRYVIPRTPMADGVSVWRPWRFRPVVALLVKASF